MYLVTGGAGFIGSHLATQLVHEGKQVRILDNLSGGTLANLAPIIDHVEFVEADIRDVPALHRAMRGVEVVFHEAAEPSVPRSIEDPANSFANNVDGTLNVLNAARDQGVGRLVFASTCAVYGDAPELPKIETLSPTPLSPYAMSKLTGEQLCTMFTRIHGLDCVALRYFNVFGPRQDPSSAYAAAIPRFLDAVKRGARPTVFGDGEQSRDFVAVSDVVRANILASEATGAPGHVYNVASGRSTTINMVLEALGRATGLDASADYQPARAGDIMHSLADISAAQQALGFEARMGFAEGLDLILHEMGFAADLVAA